MSDSKILYVRQATVLLLFSLFFFLLYCSLSGFLLFYCSPAVLLMFFSWFSYCSTVLLLFSVFLLFYFYSITVLLLSSYFLTALSAVSYCIMLQSPYLGPGKLALRMMTFDLCVFQVQKGGRGDRGHGHCHAHLLLANSLPANCDE